MSTPKGFSAQTKLSRLKAEHVTVEPVRIGQHGMTVVSHGFVFEVGTDAVEAGSTTSAIVATAHAAKKGDIVRFTSGALSGVEVKVVETSANEITVGEDLTAAPSATDGFQILRHKYPIVSSTGELALTAGPVQFVLDSVDTEVTEDTVTPANNRPLPAKLMEPVDIASSALPTGAATEATLASIDGKIIAVDTGDVTVSASALPTGAATEATLATLATEVTVATLATEATLSALNAKVTAVNTGAVVVSSSALPTGAATEVTVASIDGKITAVDTGNVTVSASALPTGAATEATLASIDGKITAVNTGAVVVSSSALPTGAATEATLATLDGKVTACNTGAVVVSSSALPTGAATEATLASIDGKVVGPYDIVDLFDTPLLDASSSNIPGSASSPLEVVASLAADVKKVQILDTTGGFIGLFTGAAASEVLKLVIGPGSDQTIEAEIASGTRISVRSLTTSALTAGNLAMNFVG